MSLGPKAVGTARALRWGAWQAAKAAVVIAVVAGGAYGVGLVPAGASGPSDGSESAVTSTGTPTEPQPSGIDIERTEALILQLVNDRRASRDMAPLARNEHAARAARAHAEDMARNDYFSHTSQEGESPKQRYAFCSGGENIAQTWVYRSVRVQGEPSETYTTAQELAPGVVEGWMNSKPHRERGIYGDSWSSAGVGVAITDSGKVYAVLGFCSR